MKLGLISDIHGRLDALEIAWNLLSKQADQILCLGDIVDGGDDAEKCITFIREKQLKTVHGNHDTSWVSLQRLTPAMVQNLRWMDALPVHLELNGLHIIHDDPTLINLEPHLAYAYSDPGYLRTAQQLAQVFAQASVFAPPTQGKIVAVGHTHRPAVFHSHGELELVPSEPLHLDPDKNWIINPGTVGGKPRSNKGNTCALIDTESRMFTLLQLTLPQQPNLWDNFFDSIFR